MKKICFQHKKSFTQGLKFYSKIFNIQSRREQNRSEEKVKLCYLSPKLNAAIATASYSYK